MKIIYHGNIIFLILLFCVNDFDTDQQLQFNTNIELTSRRRMCSVQSVAAVCLYAVRQQTKKNLFTCGEEATLATLLAYINVTVPTQLAQ